MYLLTADLKTVNIASIFLKVFMTKLVIEIPPCSIPLLTNVFDVSGIENH